MMPAVGLGRESVNIIPNTRDQLESAASAQLPLLLRLHDWVVTVDHKRLGIMYVSVGFAFLLVAGLEASLMRWQLAFPESTILSPQVFNRLFTMHGTTMVFFVGIPIVFGFANYLVPLMIGARDLAFPRLNAFGFWLLLYSGLLLYFSYLGGDGLYGAGSAPDVGWFAYSPLTGRAFSPGNSTDYWTLAILISGFGTIATSVNLVATILTMRCPGMTLGRMPLYVWMILVVSGMTLIILPPLSAAQIMLLFDRFLGAHFFDTQAGGSALLWQHFFWFFGHPEVYVLMVPGFGFASEIIPVFSRKVIFGYAMVVASAVSIGFVAMGTWAHHMFTVGLGGIPNAFFAASTMLVAVPTGVKLFNWLGTMYGGRIRFETPMLFCVAFLFQFLCAGLTGVMLAVAPFDWQLSDSYFVVAHFHFVLIGGLVFTIFAAIYYWFPKATGRRLSETLGRWHFWLFVIGFNLTFIPLHFAGVLGMPRRIYMYPADRGWDLWNLVATLGVPIQGVALLLFLINVIISLRRGQPAGDDPWDGWTLEWTTTSPPPPYNFEVLPEVKSRRPLWDLKHPDDPDWLHE
jgi:cytochrome c oxidase subunit 1